MKPLNKLIKYLPEVSIFAISLANMILYVLDDLKIIEAPSFVSTEVSMFALLALVGILLYKDAKE